MNNRSLPIAMLVCLIAAPANAAVTQTTYQINPGGQYEYKPSPWVGIPGGYDSTPVDGNGVYFQFSAQAIPEPTGMALVTAAAAALCIVRQRRH